MKTYKISEAKFELLVRTLATLELLTSREPMYLGMTDSECNSEIRDMLKVIANNDFYRNLAVTHYES
jgi:hypothetical protein